MFDKTICPKCEKAYDDHRDKCPKCHALNDSFTRNKKIDMMFWPHPIMQVVYFLIGFLLIQIIPIFVRLGLADLASKNPVYYSALLNCITYLTITIVFALVLIPEYFQLGRQFQKGFRAYLIAIIGFLVLISFSFLWSYIYSLAFPNQINDNQNSINTMTISYPILSLLSVVFFAPFVEELTYRVGLFGFLHRINRYLAYSVTIIFFALIHINFQTTNWGAEAMAIPTYLVGATILTIAYEKGGFASSYLIHLANNLLSFILIFL